jgi:transcriptional regulator with XRE-family HTH domain
MTLSGMRGAFCLAPNECHPFLVGSINSHLRIVIGSKTSHKRLEIRSETSYNIGMKKYYFTEQVSNKFKSADDFPGWLDAYPDYKEQIKIMRETLGMTQEQLGKRIGRSRRAISNIENGSAIPTIHLLQTIAEVLNAELKVCLVPQKKITDFLDEKSTQKAKKLIKLTQTSSALEVQAPSDEEILRQIEILKKEILEKRRSTLWEPM